MFVNKMESCMVYYLLHFEMQPGRSTSMTLASFCVQNCAIRSYESKNKKYRRSGILLLLPLRLVRCCKACESVVALVDYKYPEIILSTLDVFEASGMLSSLPLTIC